MKEQPPFDLQELQGKIQSVEEFVLSEDKEKTKDTVLIPKFNMCAVTVQATTHRSAHARCNSAIET